MTSTPASRRSAPDDHGSSLRDMLAAIVADCSRSRRERGLADVVATLDVPRGHAIPAAASSLRRLLDALVRRGFESSAQADDASDAPPIRELIVTSVDVGGAIEIEVADSGPGLPGAVRSWLSGEGDEMPDGAGLALAAVRAAAARIGGTVRAVNCPEGGVAITLRLPHRQSQRLAA